VNGKRRHRSALLHVNGTFGRGTVGTDLNAIAVGSIKRIEILRDGAATQYGSDAIAGVINIVTKDTTDLLDVTSETGITASRDGGQIKASANYGFKVGKDGFVNVTGEYLERHPPRHEVQIHEQSAWSCSHGVGRWYRPYRLRCRGFLHQAPAARWILRIWVEMADRSI
jgi:hypothetical protein